MKLRHAPKLPFLLFAACSVFAACGSKEDEAHGVGANGSGASSNGGASNGGASNGGAIVVPPGGAAGAAGSGIPIGPCTGLRCNQTTCTQGACTQMPCAAGTSTTVSGTVYDPAGKVPLYNVIVYVPNAEVPPFTAGAGCDRCGQGIVNPATSALTDTFGRFSLPDVPVGDNIPIVIQIGKWRRQITIPNVPRCADTPLTNIEQTSLPSNKTEGDIPLIAITTGGADSMECLPLRMGIEASEFTTEAGTGRIHLYGGYDSGMSTATTALTSGETLTPANSLWSTVGALDNYDIVILSCEGDSNENQRPMGARQAVFDYASLGGRLFASHWHHRWISEGPDPFPDVGEWNDREDPESPTPATINQSFPKGMALAQWLVNVGASAAPGGSIDIYEPRDNIQSVNTAYATEWMTMSNSNENDTPAVEYLSFNTPLTVPETQKCGRVVYTDVHVSNTDVGMMSDSPGDPFPGHCQMRDLTAQEKAVEFMLFDLSSCIQDETMPPEPPR